MLQNYALHMDKYLRQEPNFPNFSIVIFFTSKVCLNITTKIKTLKLIVRGIFLFFESHLPKTFLFLISGWFEKKLCKYFILHKLLVIIPEGVITRYL